MKITGIIAEYNPFHLGHAYHIQKAREDSDGIIAVISGDFVQRGAPALFDKYARAKMALQNGVDIVFEMPVRYACASAPYFAIGGVSTLSVSGVCDLLSFGSECGNIDDLQTAAQISGQKTDLLDAFVRQQCAKGITYPQAYENSLRHFYEGKVPDSIFDLLKTPNNLLGIEYIKAIRKLHANITPSTIPRTGAGYHDKTAQETRYPSAAMLRHAFFKQDFAAVKTMVPENIAGMILEDYKHNEFLKPDDLTLQLRYRLQNESKCSLGSYLDVNEDMANRIYAMQNQLLSWESFCTSLKTKNITYQRIARSLLHILLNIPAYSTSHHAEDNTPYLRILGLKKNKREMLHSIKKNSSVPIITKTADAKKLLSEHAQDLFREDLWCADFYESLLALKNQRKFRQEHTRGPVILDE